MEELQQKSTASYVSLSEMAIPLSLSSLSQSTSFLSSFDVALFCIVLIVTLSLGVLHTCLITKRINGPRTEKSNENYWFRSVAIFPESEAEAINSIKRGFPTSTAPPTLEAFS